MWDGTYYGNMWYDDNVHAKYMRRQEKCLFVSICAKWFYLGSIGRPTHQRYKFGIKIKIVEFVVLFSIGCVIVCMCVFVRVFHNYLVNYWRSHHLVTDDRLLDRTTVACNRLMTLKLLQNAKVILWIAKAIRVNMIWFLIFGFVYDFRQHSNWKKKNRKEKKKGTNFSEKRRRRSKYS